MDRGDCLSGIFPCLTGSHRVLSLAAAVDTVAVSAQTEILGLVDSAPYDPAHEASLKQPRAAQRAESALADCRLTDCLETWFEPENNVKFAILI